MSKLKQTAVFSKLLSNCCVSIGPVVIFFCDISKLIILTLNELSNITEIFLCNVCKLALTPISLYSSKTASGTIFLLITYIHILLGQNIKKIESVTSIACTPTAHASLLSQRDEILEHNMHTQPVKTIKNCKKKLEKEKKEIYSQ